MYQDNENYNFLTYLLNIFFMHVKNICHSDYYFLEKENQCSSFYFYIKITYNQTCFLLYFFKSFDKKLQILSTLFCNSLPKSTTSFSFVSCYPTTKTIVLNENYFDLLVFLMQYSFYYLSCSTLLFSYYSKYAHQFFNYKQKKNYIFRINK